MISRRALLTTSTAALAGVGVAGLTGCTRGESSAPQNGKGKSTDVVLAADVSSVRATALPLAVSVATQSPPQTRISTPHLLLDVVQVGVLTQIDGLSAGTLELPGAEGVLVTQSCVPAPGQEFVFVQLEVAGTVFNPSAKSAAVPGIKTGKRRNFKLGEYNSTLGRYANSFLTAVVSVPIGTPASVVVDDLDLTAGYDLRTGRNGTDAATKKLSAAAKLGAVGVSPATAKWAGGWTDGRNADVMKVEWNFDKKSCYLGRWVPSAGWAPQGKQWLVLVYRPTYKSDLFTPMTIDLGAARVKTGGKRHRPTTKRKVSVVQWMTAFDDEFLVFAVPDDFKKGTFELDFPRTLRVKYRDGQKRTWPNRGAGRPLRTTITRK